MLKGGVADKLGNGYEARWALLEALRVMQGQAQEIRLEPFNEDSVGLEFRVTTAGRNAWHQCKRRRVSGRWTVKALADEGVLDAFGRKLADPATECVFVSSDPAPDLGALAGKARLVGGARDFRDALNQDERTALQGVGATWGVAAEAAYDRLRRCRVEVVSDDTLDRQIGQLCDLLFADPPETAANLLAAFLNGQLTRSLTTDVLRVAVGDLGLQWRARLDPTIPGRVADATDAYLRSLGAPVADVPIQTPAINAVAATVLEGDLRLLVVGGGAGAGKSFALAGAVEAARSRGWPVLALRVDRHLEAASLEALGEMVLGRRENLAGVFGNHFGLAPCLLVLDQVDAVSEASGRSHQVRDLVLRMLRDAQVYPELRVVLACRTYDLENDGELSRLAGRPGASKISLPPLDWDQAVQPVMDRLGLVGRKFSPRQQKVLAVPIQLKLFTTLVQAGETPLGDLSGPELFDALLKVRARQFVAGSIGWDLRAALGAMAEWMSRRQVLAAPDGVLSGFPGAADALASAGLIAVADGKVQFAHESFFDHVYSADFVSRSGDLLELLRSDAQRMFRRTQVRQILARLRAVGPAREYLRQLAEVMAATDVRYLVKDAIAMWLASLPDATDQEIALVEGWYVEGGPLDGLAATVIGHANWTGPLLRSGLLSRWIAREGRHRSVGFGLLNRAALVDAEAVARVLRAWWSGRADRVEPLCDWFRRLFPEGCPVAPLELLYVELVAALPDAAVEADLFANFDLSMWAHQSPAFAARALGLWMRRWLVAYPDEQPFRQYAGQDNAHGLREIAEHAPLALLETLLPTLGEALRRDAQAVTSGRADHLTLRVPFVSDDDIILIAAQAIDRAAPTAPGPVAELLQSLPDEGEVPLWLQLRAIAANGEALGEGLLGLLRRPKLLELGYDGPWIPFAEAAHSAMPFLAAEGRAEVEAVATAHWPEFARAQRWARATAEEGDFESGIPRRSLRSDSVRMLSGSGVEQRAILTRIGVDRLSVAGGRRLAELDRKFFPDPVLEAHGIKGGWVQSPITPEQAARMSDAQWLRAIRKYNGTQERIYRAGEIVGGAEQLAHVLGGRAKEEPARFTALLERLPPEALPEYAIGILDGVGQASPDPELAIRAFYALDRWPQADAARSIAWLVQRTPGAARDPRLFATLISLAEDGEASDTAVTTAGEKRPPSTIDEMIGGGDLEISGLNGVRGSAYEALARALWDHDDGIPAIVELLDRRIEAEHLTSVRMSMMHTINAVLGRDIELGVRFLCRVAERDPRALLGRGGRHLLNWAVNNRSGDVEGLVLQLAGQTEEGLRALGSIHLAVLALLYPDREADFIAQWEGEVLRRRAAARVASSNLSSDAAGARAAAWLPKLFDDADPDVRREASRVAWDRALDQTAYGITVAHAFVDSAAFAEHGGGLLHSLGKREHLSHDLTHRALKRALTVVREDTAGRGTRSLEYRLGALLMPLYRLSENDPQWEGEILDQFDLYLATNRYGVRDEINAFERD